MVAQQTGKPFLTAATVTGYDRTAAGLDIGGQTGGDRIEQDDIRAIAGSRKILDPPPTQRHGPGTIVRLDKRGKGTHRPCGQRGLPFTLGQVKALGGQRVIDEFRTAAALLLRPPGTGKATPGFVIFADQRHPLAHRLFDRLIEGHRAVGEVIEQCFEFFHVKQWQPMLHPRMALARTHRLIEQIVAADGTE